MVAIEMDSLPMFFEGREMDTPDGGVQVRDTNVFLGDQ